MSILNEAFALYSRGDFSGSLVLYEQAERIFGRHVVEVNIILCKKKLGEKASQTYEPPLNSSTLTHRLSNVAEPKATIAEQGAVVRRTLFDNKNTKRLNEAIRYPTSPSAECIVDLMVADPPSDHRDGASRINDALTFGRYALAEQWLREALIKTPEEIQLLLLAARIDFIRGNYEQVVVKLLTLLEEQNNLPDALRLLANAYSRTGKLLEAMAIMTNGQGLTAWRERPPTKEHVKLAVQMDWVGVAMSRQDSNANLIRILEKSCSLTGSPGHLDAATYSLFFFSDVRNIIGGESAELFLTLHEQMACMQVARLDSAAFMSEIECVGSWAFVFTEPLAVDRVLLNAIYAQKRINESVVKIMKCQMNAAGVPKSFHLAGVLASADVLSLFGKATLVDWLKAAERSLRIKTVLI